MIRLLVPALMALLLVAPAEAQSLEQMAGQMIIVGFSGDDPSDKSVQAVAAELGASKLGGVMYLKPNVKSLKAVKAMRQARAVGESENGRRGQGVPTGVRSRWD